MNKEKTKSILLYFTISVDGNYIIKSKDFDILIERLSDDKPKKTEAQKLDDIQHLLEHKGISELFECTKCKLQDNGNFLVVIKSSKSKYPQTLECEVSENELPDINRNEKNNTLSFGKNN